MLPNVKTVLITGASGGIGEAFARQLAAQGKNMVLAARSQDKLEALAEELAKGGRVGAHVIAADLAQPGSAGALYAKTEEQGLVIDLLVNNAGYGKGGAFTDLSFDVQADMVRLNVNALIELTHLYLPGMRQRQVGGVINVGSTASFQPVPYMAVYGATKAFVLSFSEALAAELTSEEVHVMALCPGATATGFQATAGVWEDQRDSMPTADEVVEQALSAFERGRPFFIHGAQNKIMAITARVSPPPLVTKMAARLVRAQS